MRLFVALSPPEPALAELDAALSPLRAAWPDLRWASAERWHVTLAFLGEVAEPRLGELTRRLERAAARHGGQQLAIGGGGAFPSPSRARVLIARIEGGQDSAGGLAGLAASVGAAARRAGAPPPDEGRKYRPHLTLARCRQPANLSELVRALPDRVGRPWLATEIFLIRSQNGPVPRYDTLGCWPLRPA